MKDLKPLSDETLSFFFGQLTMMVHAGIPLLQGVSLLAADLPKKPQRQRLQEGLYLMEQGCPFSVVMTQSRLFPPLACQIMAAGESSGMVETMLSLLRAYYEKTNARRQRIIQALAYPVFLLVCTGLFGIAAIVGIVPVFADMFAQLGIPVPPATQALLDVSTAVRHHGRTLALGSCLSAAFVVYAGRRQDIRQHIMTVLLTSPLIRRVCLILCWQRFSQILAIQLSSGIPVLQALTEASAAVPSIWFRKAMMNVQHGVAQGKTLSQAVRKERLSTAYIETMLRIGETTGKYEEALEAISLYYQWQIDKGLTLIQQALGPAVLLIVGASVGAMLLCVFMPLLDVASGMTATGGM